MNTIKFSNINDMRKETNNVEIYDINDIIIDDIKYKYYTNAQISLYVTKKCNGNCWFCMNNYEKRFCQSIELDDENYFYNIDRMLDNFEKIKPPITITGGEPTKDKKLITIIRKIHNRGFRTRTFATNGTGLFDRYEGKTIITHLLENGVINNINVSRMTVDDKQNKRIMGVNQSNADIKTIFTYGNTNGMDIRLSCNLQKDGVKNLDDILKYVNFYSDLEVNTIMFRELISIKDASKYYNDRIINIEPIFNEIESNEEFEFLRTLEGMYYIVKVYRYKDRLVKCYQEKVNHNIENSVIREFVFYPDGNLDKGWNKDNNIVLKFEDKHKKNGVIK